MTPPSKSMTKKFSMAFFYAPYVQTMNWVEKWSHGIKPPPASQIHIHRKLAIMSQIHRTKFNMPFAVNSSLIPKWDKKLKNLKILLFATAWPTKGRAG